MRRISRELFAKQPTICCSSRRGLAAAAGEEAPLVKTSFYDLHMSLGGKMVPFAGYSLPVQYDGLGVLKEHLHTRAENSASLFDVSHMGQIKWYGKDAVKFIEKMVVGDIASLKEGEAKLSLIMNEHGGIVDDTVIANAGDHIYMVVNGACKYKDMDHFNKYLQGSGLDVQMEYQGEQQLLALQGKGAHQVLAKLAPSLNLAKMDFMSGVYTTVAGQTFVSFHSSSILYYIVITLFIRCLPTALVLYCIIDSL